MIISYASLTNTNTALKDLEINAKREKDYDING